MLAVVNHDTRNGERGKRKHLENFIGKAEERSPSWNTTYPCDDNAEFIETNTPNDNESHIESSDD